METLTAKRGDTLIIRSSRTDPDTGLAVSLVGVTVSSEMTLKDARQALTATVTDAEDGLFELGLTAAQTAALRPGLWSCDVQFTTDATGEVTSTATFLVDIVKDITGAG